VTKQKRTKNKRKTIKENLELGDLRAEVMHAAQQPYFRFSDKKLLNYDKQAKKDVKEFWREEARRMSHGTHYVINNKCLDVIVPSLKKASVRKFINAFWQARAPHRNFFIEFDIRYLFTQLLSAYEKNPNDKYLQSMLGDSYTASRAGLGIDSLQLLAGVSLKHRRNPSGTVIKDPGVFSKSQKVPMPSCDELSFFTAQRFHEGPRRETTLHASPVCLQVLAPEDFEKKMATKIGQAHLREKLEPFNGHTFLKEVFELESVKDYDGLWDVSKLLTFVLHSTYDIDNATAANDFQTPTKHFIGFEALVIQIYFAAISLLNYDWAVNEETGEIARGTKSVNTESVAQDRYIKVTINLPKDKAIKLFNKQRPRTRKFGTAEHLVRGHWRLYKKSGERVWIKEHERGDEKYGTVHKDYVLTKRDDYLRKQATK
jgi:hypothetical protein